MANKNTGSILQDTVTIEKILLDIWGDVNISIENWSEENGTTLCLKVIDNTKFNKVLCEKFFSKIVVNDNAKISISMAIFEMYREFLIDSVIMVSKREFNNPNKKLRDYINP